MTLDYCKHESVALSAWVLFCLMTLIIVIVANFFVSLNELRLPYYFAIFFLPLDEPFDGISFNWLINFLYQAVAVFWSGTFITIFFAFSVLLLNHTLWLIDATISVVESLTQRIGEETEDKAQKKKAIDGLLTEIVEMVLEVQEWQEGVQKLMGYIFLVDFNVLSVFICMCVFSLTESFFESIPVLLAFSVIFSELFVFCWLGSRIVSRVERLAATLYDTEWYSMDRKQQKHLQMSIVMTQNMKGFNGIFSDVNLETFTAVCELHKFF